MNARLAPFCALIMLAACAGCATNEPVGNAEAQAESPNKVKDPEQTNRERVVNGLDSAQEEARNRPILPAGR